MKARLISIFLFLSLIVNAQQKDFLIEGQVVDQFGNAIPDVYIVNLRNHEKDISRDNGVFSIWVSPSDSLVLSHIAYFRKVSSVHSLLINPLVSMVSEDVNIPEIRISSRQFSDYDRAIQNMEFMNEYKVPEFTKIDNDPDPVGEMATANNELMRSEAASIRIVAFSPAEQIQKLYVKLKRKDARTDYPSSRKVKSPPTNNGNN